MSSSRNYVLSITIIGILFFIFGFITWLNGTLIPFLKLACDLHSDAQALLVTFAFLYGLFLFGNSVIIYSYRYRLQKRNGAWPFCDGPGCVDLLAGGKPEKLWVIFIGSFRAGHGLVAFANCIQPLYIRHRPD